MKIKEVNMLEGSIVKGILSMAIPVMIMNVMQSLYNIIDTTMLGNLVGDDAVGSVGACGSLCALITSVVIGLSTGANVVVAKHIGKGDIEGAEKATGSAILVSICCGVVLSVLGFIFARELLKWINCDEALLDDAVVYFRLYFCALPFTLIGNYSASILRATGDTKRPMAYYLISGGAKVLFNFIFIVFFKTTVEGVGISFILSSLIASSLMYFTVLKNKGKVRFKFKYFRFYKKLVGEMFYIGIPTGLQSAFYSLANVLITSVVNGFGKEATTGVSIASHFDGLLYQIIMAPSIAVMPYIAQNIGAKNLVRVKQSISKSILLTAIVGGTIGAATAIFSRQLASIMTSTPAVIDYAQQRIVLLASLYFICGISEILIATLRALGKPIAPMITSFMFMCVLRFIWIYFIYPLYPTLFFLYLVWPVGWVLCILANLCLLFPAIKKLNKRIASEKLAINGQDGEVASA